VHQAARAATGGWQHTQPVVAGVRRSAGLVAALGPTVLLGTASGLLISNAWAVASDRAVKAGKVLAHLLLSGAHGDRPVTLVSHGMGARLVFHCLLELCRQGARGVVQHAVLMGAPVGTEAVRWRMARRAVAGRLVNCYTRKDWLLGVCAGGSSGWMKATSGLVPIEVCGVAGGRGGWGGAGVCVCGGGSVGGWGHVCASLWV
jgi:pimeloyl-ACP methyl ester carboxylesterase